MTTKIFDLTERPNPSLFFKKNDPNDARWGERVLTDPQYYHLSSVVLLGFPQDVGVSRNKGRVGAKEAPTAIRRCFYKTVALPAPILFDLGDTLIEPEMSLEDMHARHYEIVRRLMADGKKVIVLGGGNDTSYPDCSALADFNNQAPLAFNIDAHFDVRADKTRNSGTPYRQLLEEGKTQADQFYEIAYQPFANSDVYQAYLGEKGVKAHSLSAVRAKGITPLLTEILAQSQANYIFWGLDMDVVRGSDAPGVSALNPTGLTGEEVCEIATLAGADPRTRIFEITEVNPHYDIDDRTCRLAGVVLWHFLRSVGQD
jgi:formiminoglutamase